MFYRLNIIKVLKVKQVQDILFGVEYQTNQYPLRVYPDKIEISWYV